MSAPTPEAVSRLADNLRSAENHVRLMLARPMTHFHYSTGVDAVRALLAARSADQDRIAELEAELHNMTVARDWFHRQASDHEAKMVADQDRIRELEGETEQLRLAICGGEDAPGYAASLPLSEILRVADENASSWRAASDRAVTAEQHNLRMVDRINQTIEWLQEDPGAIPQIERLLDDRDWPLRQVLATALHPNTKTED